VKVPLIPRTLTFYQSNFKPLFTSHIHFITLLKTRLKMPSNQISKSQSSAHQQQLQQSSQHARDVETQEHHASANASAGLNLNLFGALSGAFSSKSKKTTHTNADGSSTATEDKHDQGMFFSHSPFPSVFFFPLTFTPTPSKSQHVRNLRSPPGLSKISYFSQCS
jgi:hypothetical protein